jgi:hypothetical protein
MSADTWNSLMKVWTLAEFVLDQFLFSFSSFTYLRASLTFVARHLECFSPFPNCKMEVGLLLTVTTTYHEALPGQHSLFELKLKR